MIDIDDAFEAQTELMADESVSTKPKAISCTHCKGLFSSEIIYGSMLDDIPNFCSEECVHIWNDENQHDYEED